MADVQDNARLIDRIAGSLLARYVRYVRNTSWQVAEMDRTVAANVRHHPCVVAMWHGEFMLLPLIKPADKPTDIMLARHSDAEFLGKAALRRIREQGVTRRLVGVEIEGGRIEMNSTS